MWRITALAKPEQLISLAPGISRCRSSSTFLRAASSRSYCMQMAAALAALGDEHRQLERLLMIESRIDGGAVGTLQVRIRQAASASGALGDVVASELDVHSAEVRTHLGVNAERDIQLLQ